MDNEIREHLKDVEECTKCLKNLMLKAHDRQLDYDRESVEFLDGFVETTRNSDAFDEKKRKQLVDMIGSFLGECFRVNYGGEWAILDDRLGVKFTGNNVAFPYTKVWKQYENGFEDSILSFYETFPLVMEHALKTSSNGGEN